MVIRKIKHCCFIIEAADAKIMTDPGGWSSGQTEETGVDLIVITHEHPDHLHIESLKTVRKNNPEAPIVTNRSVGGLLADEDIAYQVIEHGQREEIAGVTLEGIGNVHAEIYEEFNRVQNTGYRINDRLLFPGDAFPYIDHAVDVLALPVAGPWMRLADALDWLHYIRPETAFPVHDGMWEPDKRGPIYKLPAAEMATFGGTFIELKEGEETDV